MKIGRVAAVLTLATLTTLAAVGCDAKAGSGSPLITAARQDDLASVRMLIKNGVSVDARDRDGDTAMHSAAKHGHVDVIHALIKEGHARVDAHDEDGETPLDLACKYGQVDAARALIVAGANVNSKDNMRWTPLHFAARQGSAEIVKMLLDKKADPNVLAFADDEEMEDDEKPSLTPLRLAADKGHVEVGELLRDHGAIK